MFRQVTGRLSLRTRLLGAFFLLAALSVAAMLVAVFGAYAMAGYDAQASTAHVRIEQLREMKSISNMIARDMRTEGAAMSASSSTPSAGETTLADMSLLLTARRAYEAAFSGTPTSSPTRDAHVIDAAIEDISTAYDSGVSEEVLVPLLSRLDAAVDAAVGDERAIASDSSGAVGRIARVALEAAIASSILIVMLALIFGVLVDTGVVQPLIRLKEFARKVARGDFSPEMPEPTIGEMGELTQAVAGMIRNVQASYADLRGRAREDEERTVQLTETVRERTRELHEEHARLYASIMNLPLGFLLTDREGRIMLHNPAVLKMLGLERDPRMLSDIVFEHSGQEHAGNLSTACEQCVEARASIELGEVLHGKKILRISCTRILGDEGDREQVIGHVFLVQDVTEQKIMERSREEFFALASHELRTPLTAIRGNADLLLEAYGPKLPDEEMRGMLHDIHASSMRLIEIVNDFLEVSRLEQGKVTIHKEPFDIRDVIEKVVRDFTPQYQACGLTLAFVRPAQAPPHILADKARVEQVLVNLVGNAQKFTKAGGVTISTEIIHPFIKVMVADTGIGIAPVNQNLLFRKFQQAGEHVLTRDITQGTGLGLYICHHLISAMGGTIGLEKSEPGKGSVFSFTLPFGV